MPNFAKFKPLAAYPKMIPATVLVPLPGANVLNVFSTGGMADTRQWINGRLDGAGSFYSLDSALAAAERADSFLVKRGDHLAVIPRGGIFDVGY